MIKRITLSHIIFLLLPSCAVDAQSSSPRTKDVSSDHMLVALVCIILVVTIFSIFLRHCSNTNTGHVNTGGAATITNCASSIPQGIDPKFLNTFPIVIYSTQKFHVAPNECSVCLNEFNQNDVLRLLPKCNHLFHPPCIDAWLASHVTCPVCRTCLSQADNGGDHEVVIVIPDVVNSEGMFDESCESRREVNSGYVIRTLGRCHSTGHSMGFGEIGGKDMEGYSIWNLEDVKKNINKISHGGMRRSASSGVLVNGHHGEKESIESILFLNKTFSKI